MEDIRKNYATEFKSGEWTFVGFANYRDNFLTENLKDAPNPKYPMVSEPSHGDKTAQKLDTVVSDNETNLCIGASIHRPTKGTPSSLANFSTAFRAWSKRNCRQGDVVPHFADLRIG